MVRSAFSASFLIAAGTFGSFVASAICTLTSPFSMWTAFTRPNETISRVKPGYFTDFKAFFTCSSEIDMSETYACLARGKPHRCDLAVLIIHFVANLKLVSARGARRLLAAFRYKVRILPIRPGAVFRPHRIGRQLEAKKFVFATGEF